MSKQTEHFRHRERIQLVLAIAAARAAIAAAGAAVAAVGAAAVALITFTSGCDPRVFDELADDTWVRASEPPGGLSSQDYAIALASPGQAPADGAHLFALARNQDGLAYLRYRPSGSLEQTAILLSDVGIDAVTSLSNRPAIAADDDSPRVAVGLQSGSDGGGVHLLLLDAATGRTITPTIDLDGITPVTALDFGGRNPASPDAVTVARGAALIAIADITDITGAVADAPQCLMPRGPVDSMLIEDLGPTDNARRVIIAAAPADGNTGSEILLLASDIIESAAASVGSGELANCLAGNREPLATIPAPDGATDFGQTLITADINGNGRLDLVASAPSREAVYVYLDLDVQNIPDPIEMIAPADAASFGHAISAANLDGLDGDELIIGAPDTERDGAVAAGAVYIYRFSDSGLTDPIVLADAQPEGGQRFGQSAAVAGFGGQDRPLLVIGSSQEVYAYFRTPLSPDLRE